MKSINKIGLVEKVLNYFGYYKPVWKKTRKPRKKKEVNQQYDPSGRAVNGPGQPLYSESGYREASPFSFP